MSLSFWIWITKFAIIILLGIQMYLGFFSFSNTPSTWQKVVVFVSKQLLSIIKYNWKRRKSTVTVKKKVFIKEEKQKAMACASCAQKQQLLTNARALQEVNQEDRPCDYTLEELQEKRQIAFDANDTLLVAILNSAINFYAKDCNKYSSYL